MAELTAGVSKEGGSLHVRYHEHARWMLQVAAPAQYWLFPGRSSVGNFVGSLDIL
jgi:hypothetical protein